MTTIAAEEPRCVWDAKRLLGEGVWWSADEQTLYWLDIKDPAIMRCNASGGERRQWRSPQMIGCFSPCANGGYIGGFESGLAKFELGVPGSGFELHSSVQPKEFEPTDRFNDGKCHPDGSFWAGTMDDKETRERGHFYRLSRGYALTEISGPHMVCNGPAFTADGTTAYLTDSAARTIYRLDLTDSGKKSEFLTFTEPDGYPDGMATDRQGNLWIAFWDGWKVMCISAKGERLLEIQLPVARPTSCALGGKDLSTLFITSARIGLTDAELAKQPLAGGLFACEITGTKGWPSPVFSG